jgi:hypothetical protein
MVQLLVAEVLSRAAGKGGISMSDGGKVLKLWSQGWRILWIQRLRKLSWLILTQPSPSDIYILLIIATAVDAIACVLSNPSTNKEGTSLPIMTKLMHFYFFTGPDKNPFSKSYSTTFQGPTLPKHLGKSTRIWKRDCSLHLRMERNSAHRQGFGKLISKSKNQTIQK